MTDLQLTGLHDIGQDYARTLQIWRERFLQRLQDVRRLGYPDEFVRMWEWYLAYCEGGFLERAISAVQVVFDKPECRLQPPFLPGYANLQEHVMNSLVLRSLCLVACIAVAACAPGNPVILKDGADGGLLPVRDSGLREAWVRPDINFSSYRQILLLPTEVQFRPVRPGADNGLARSRNHEFPVSPADRQRLLDTVNEVAREELATSRHLTLTDTPGPDVLLVRISLLDVDLPGATRGSGPHGRLPG